MGNPDGGFTSTDNEEEENDDSGESDDNDINEEVQSLQEEMDDRGVEVLNTRREEDIIVAEIQTSGNLDDDTLQTASAYATLSYQLDDDLRVHVEDRGLHQETFEIELEWAREVADDRMTDQEFLDRIDETRTDDK